MIKNYLCLSCNQRTQSKSNELDGSNCVACGGPIVPLVPVMEAEKPMSKPNIDWIERMQVLQVQDGDTIVIKV